MVYVIWSLLHICLHFLNYVSIGFCEHSINSTEYIVTYDMTPSYTQSTATLRCIKGYASVKPGSAVCGDDGEWIIEYPKCEGTYMKTYTQNQLLLEYSNSVLSNLYIY